MSKVPCGGFELDESLALNNGKLGLAPGAGGGLPTGEAPYQQLVTDGDGNPKWEDRLAYEIVTETEVVPEQTVAFSKDGGMMAAEISINNTLLYGDSVTVTWDGISYNSSLQSYNAFGVFGNLGLIGAGEDSGEPFVGIYHGNGVNLVTPDSSTEHVISIIKCDSEKIFPTYFSKQLKVTISGSDADGFSASSTADEIRNALMEDRTVFADYNGHVFYLHQDPSTNDGIAIFRAMNTFGGYTDRFTIESFDVNRDGNVSHYYELGGIVVNSSTSGSSKKFLITVDDSGTISATEVTT